MNEPRPSDVRGVVLAGGDSTRFADGDKALAPVAGRPLLARVVAAHERATGRPPVVVVRTDDQRATYADVLGADVAFATDDRSFEGPVAGVLGAAAAADDEWLFVTGCDMPALSPAAVRWLAARRDESVDAVAVRHPDGAYDPLHALYRRRAVLAARETLDSADAVAALLDALAVGTVSLSSAPADVPLSASLSNVNTRADLGKATRR